MKSLAFALVLFTACGDDAVRHLGDAPPIPDASVDAAIAPVSLKLTFDGVPRPGVDVYFQDAASTLIAVVPTGSDGIAAALMEPGGFVTVIDAFPLTGKSSPKLVRTFAGVKPGDLLLVDEGYGGPPQLSVTLTVPVDTSASQYDVYTSCSGKHTLVGAGGSGGVPSGTIYMQGCNGFADVLVQTFDYNGQPLGWFYHPDVAVSDQQAITLTDTYATTSTDVTMMFTNVPAEFSSIAFRTVLASPRGPVSDVVLSTDVTGGAASASFSRPPVTNGISVTALRPLPSNNIGAHTVVQWGAPSVLTIDLANALLPLYTTFPSFTPATHSVSWTAGAGIAPDLVIGEVSAYRFTGPPNASWRWRIVAPYATTLTLPVLPAAIAEYNIATDDQPSLAELTTAKVPGGYDAVRARLHTIRDAFGLEGFVAGATGRIVYETLQNQR